MGPIGCTTQIHSRTEWDHWDAPLSALNRRAEWDHWDAPLSRAPFMSVVQRGSRRPPRTWAVSDSVLLSHRVEPHRCLLNLSEYPHQRAGRRTPTIHVRWEPGSGQGPRDLWLGQGRAPVGTTPRLDAHSAFAESHRKDEAASARRYDPEFAVCCWLLTHTPCSESLQICGSPSEATAQ